MKKLFYLFSVFFMSSVFALAQTNKMKIDGNGVLIGGGSNQINYTSSGTAIENGSSSVTIKSSGVTTKYGSNQINVTSNGTAITNGSSQLNVTSNGILSKYGSNQLNVTQDGTFLNVGSDHDIQIWPFGISIQKYNTNTTEHDNVIIGNYGADLWGVNINNFPNVNLAYHDPANISYGLCSQQKLGLGFDMAIRTVAYSFTPLSRGRSFGINSAVGNATTGWNYGVYTKVHGINKGTALYAAATTADINTPSNVNEYIDGNFAGYFNGRVHVSERMGIGWVNPSYTLDVNGTVWCWDLINYSDSRAKTNVADLKNNMGQIGKLRPVTYNFKSNDYSEYYDILERSAVMDTGKVVINNDDDLRRYFALEEKKDDNRKRIGFIAQEFREVFPELVYEDEKGRLSINYVSLIPVLVGTTQEQNETIQKQNRTILEMNEAIQDLEKQVEVLLKINEMLIKRLDALEIQNNTIHSQGESAKNFSFSLFPNPTNGFVSIDYTLFVDAPICIELFNIFGQRVKLILPQQNQKSGIYSVQTSIADLGTGTYIVKVTSGSQTDSKQLINN